MTGTATAVRALHDHIATTGSLTEAEWSMFKAEHGVEPPQVEPTLLLTLQHVLTLANALQAEVGFEPRTVSSQRMRSNDGESLQEQDSRGQRHC